MARNCPDCKAEMEDDGVHGWCVAAACRFRGYVVMRSGTILRDSECRHTSYSQDRVTGECTCDECEAVLIDCLGRVLEN